MTDEEKYSRLTRLWVLLQIAFSGDFLKNNFLFLKELSFVFFVGKSSLQQNLVGNE